MGVVSAMYQLEPSPSRLAGTAMTTTITMAAVKVTMLRAILKSAYFLFLAGSIGPEVVMARKRAGIMKTSKINEKPKNINDIMLKAIAIPGRTLSHILDSERCTVVDFGGAANTVGGLYTG